MAFSVIKLKTAMSVYLFTFPSCEYVGNHSVRLFVFLPFHLCVLYIFIRGASCVIVCVCMCVCVCVCVCLPYMNILFKH